MTFSLRDLSSTHDFAGSVRALSRAGRAAFPFSSMRRAFRSLVWPSAYKRAHLSPDYEIPQPDVSYDIDGTAEAQGLAFDNRGRQILVTTNSTYAIMSGYETSYEPPAIPPGCEGYFRKELDGILYTGRRQLDDKTGTHPHKHLSAPTTYDRFIVLPAEGEMVRFDDSDSTADGTYQMLWVLDMETHGYVGRIMLDAVRSGLGTSLAWCSIDPESQLIYASSYGDNAGARISLKVFRLPEEDTWDLLRSVVPSLEMGQSAARSAKYPCVEAEFLGSLPLEHSDGHRFTLRWINGGVVTSAGHIYLSFNKKDRDEKDETVHGLMGIDLLTGREVQYISLSFLDSAINDKLIQGLTTFGETLHACIYDWDFFDNDWSKAIFSAADGGPL